MQIDVLHNKIHFLQAKRSLYKEEENMKICCASASQGLGGQMDGALTDGWLDVK